MPVIILTQGKVALVSEEDFENLNQYKWYANLRCGNYYAVRRSWDKVNKMYKTIYMHKLILPTLNQVDHIDGDTLNNSRSNLREATSLENCANIGIRSTNKSGFKGVHWSNKLKKYVAQITSNYKTETIGYYSNSIDAAKAYDARTIELNGQFARTNKMMNLY